MRLFPCLLVCILASGPAPARAESRRDSLEHLLRTLPPTTAKITGRINTVDKTWEDWVRRTGELPPDWASLPKNAFLPEPLQDQQGHPIRTKEAWQQRRQWI